MFFVNLLVDPQEYKRWPVSKGSDSARRKTHQK